MREPPFFKDRTSEEMKAQILSWKSQLTIQDILMHQARL